MSGPRGVPASPAVGGPATGDDEPLRVVLVEDEPLARQRLRRLLAEHGGVSVVAEAHDVEAATRQIADRRPDVVFLDVRMPGGDAFDVLAALAVEPPFVVFVTAHAEHAVRAFDAAAVDYLLKPVEEGRLAESLARARRALAARRLAPYAPLAWFASSSPDAPNPRVSQTVSADEPAVLPAPGAPGFSTALIGAIRDELRALFGGREGWAGGDVAGRAGRAHAPAPGASAGLGAPADLYLDRFAVTVGRRTMFVRVDEVDWMRADRNYVRLRVGDREHLVRAPIGALERRLDPRRFARVHRSTIVRLDRVRELRTLGSGEYRLLMADGTQLEVSRAYRHRLPRGPGDGGA